MNDMRWYVVLTGIFSGFPLVVLLITLMSVTWGIIAAASRPTVDTLWWILGAQIIIAIAAWWWQHTWKPPL
jgi:hypothetical protein